MPRRMLTFLLICLCLAPASLRGQEPAVKTPNFDSNGVKIHYVVKGNEDGEPVLLIHGFTGDIDAQWLKTIKELEKDYKVIAFDCRGHGGSEKPHDPKMYGLEMSKDAIRLLDHLKIEKAHIAGYSMGGFITLQLAARYPERVRTATLGGAGLPLPGREKLYEALADSLEQGKGIGPLIEALTPKDRPKPSEEQMKMINAYIMSRNDPKALAAVMRGGFVDKNLPLTDEQIKGIKVPMLALIGGDDPLKAGVDALAKKLPEMKVVVFDKADHIQAFGRDEFVNGMKEFLDQHRQKK
ncbi:MAG TPA: alpha/beta hydrolase [Gemmataceae bacterium]|nr:alpha/beta hydrolase [Gemmataceae bacterium]